MSKEILTLNSQTVIGMVHCLPLPTTAGFDGDYQRIIDRAVQDAVTCYCRKYGGYTFFRFFK